MPLSRLLPTPLMDPSFLSSPPKNNGRNPPRCLLRPTVDRSTLIPAARLHRGPQASLDPSAPLSWKCPAPPAVCRPPRERERSAAASTIVVARYWRSDFLMQLAPLLRTFLTLRQPRKGRGLVSGFAFRARGNLGIFEELFS